MINYPIIVKYLTLKFLKYLFLISFATITVLFVSSAFDILQKFKSSYISPQDFWLLILLKIPFLFNEISTIAAFVSTILFLRSLSLSNELIVILTNGIPIWRVFAVPITTSIAFGIIIIAVINPFATFGLKEYDKVEAKLLGETQGGFFISKSGIFFYEKYFDTNRIIQAKSVNTVKKSISNITILVVDEENKLIRRIDSELAILDNGEFILNNALDSNQINGLRIKMLKIKTNLSINNLIQRFRPPEMISVWDLPESIDKIDDSGLPTIKYQLYFFKQLFKPLSIAAMVFLACWFLNLNNRDSSLVKNLIISLITGLSAYFLLEIMLHILSYGGLPPILATLLPIAFIILISNFVILHFQEA